MCVRVCARSLFVCNQNGGAMWFAGSLLTHSCVRFQAVKKIKDKRVWQNMAEMCVKTKRIDVAEICMGQLENAKGAMAVRKVSRSLSLLAFFLLARD